jgi:hypothetical protein
MMKVYGQFGVKYTFRRFLECTGLEPERLYVNVIVCADESAIHDPMGRAPGSLITVVAGYAAFGHSWEAFSRKWMAVLKKYHPKAEDRFFHFRDFANKSHQAKNPKWRYHGWNENRRHDYLIELATIAGQCHGLLVAGALNNPTFQQKREELRNEAPALYKDETSHRRWIKQFFLSFYRETKRHWPSLSATVDFVLDQSSDREWLHAAQDIFGECKRDYPKPPLGDLRFADKRTYIPLQAADMLTYRLRQITERASKGGPLDNSSELDVALFKDRWERLYKLTGMKMVIGE